MSLSLEAKKAIVSEIAIVAAEAPSAIAAEYIGLTVAEMTELRKTAREAGIYLKVVRNTLAQRAFENTNFECMRDGLVGPLLLAFSNEEQAKYVIELIKMALSTVRLAKFRLNPML